MVWGQERIYETDMKKNYYKVQNLKVIFYKMIPLKKLNGEVFF